MQLFINLKSNTVVFKSRSFVGGFKDIPFLQLISKGKNLLLDRIEACHFFCTLPRELVKTRGMNNYHRRTSWVG